MTKKRVFGGMLFLAAVMFFQIESIWAENAAVTTWVTIEGTNFAADSMDGVDAIYTEEANAPDDPIYSCAAYVKKYYQEIYGVTVYNLMDDGPPLIAEKGHTLFLSPTPKKGDILFWPTRKGGNNHSAIVKEFDGEWITIIEQNYKTGVQAAAGRKIAFSDLTYEVWRLDAAGTSNAVQNTMEGNPGTVTGVFGNEISGVEGKDTGSGETPLQTEQEAEAEVMDAFVNIPADMIPPKNAVQEDFWHDTEDSYDIPESILGLPQGQASLHAAQEGLGMSGTLTKPATAIGNTKPTEPVQNKQEAFENAEEAAKSTIMVPPAEDHQKTHFSDVPKEHWAYSAIEKCVALGFFKGYEDGTFLPDQSITRSELAVILTLAAKGEPVEGDTGFQDVGFLEWYNGYIGFAKRFIVGYTLEGHSFFAPHDPAERQDVCEAVALLLAVDLSAADTAVLNQFADRDSIYKDREKAVAFCVSAGIINGYEDSTFQGSTPVSRAQMAVILAHIF